MKIPDQHRAQTALGQVESFPPEAARRRLLSEQDVAVQYGVNIRWLQKARVSGGGPPFVKIGARVFYRVLDVERFIASRVRGSTSDQGDAA